MSALSQKPTGIKNWSSHTRSYWPTSNLARENNTVRCGQYVERAEVEGGEEKESQIKD